MRIHGVQTGGVTLKSAHYRLRRPSAFRLPAILLDPHWTSPKPILSWVIEHPEGLIVVDTGERHQAQDLNRYLAGADPVTRMFIRRNFRLHVEASAELGAQLPRLGLCARDVRWVILTHLHFDHADGLAFFPEAEVLVSRREYDAQRRVPQGAVFSLWPEGLTPSLIDYSSGAYSVFPKHWPLTQAGDVLLVPTPGHSYGHQSVLILDHDVTYFLAGDVVFDEGQLQRREIGGIVQDVGVSRASLELVRHFVLTHPTVFLPSHDPTSLERLANRQVTHLEERHG
ncbi:N-acyl homoserine lactonase family protein [Deinococcus sp. Arct2-2]|uniref:N-acyl homoserine lactonase family protein n=1 Tax=Deinococcus sp. Arct2-2 TaxID=2568653 RepID=UPI001454CB6C|nr:N-acyl homoserine lactonase family protein [Deinococcus sp. Arct2-2]